VFGERIDAPARARLDALEAFRRARGPRDPLPLLVLERECPIISRGPPKVVQQIAPEAEWPAG